MKQEELSECTAGICFVRYQKACASRIRVLISSQAASEAARLRVELRDEQTAMAAKEEAHKSELEEIQKLLEDERAALAMSQTSCEQGRAALAQSQHALKQSVGLRVLCMDRTLTR